MLNDFDLLSIQIVYHCPCRMGDGGVRPSEKEEKVTKHDRIGLCPCFSLGTSVAACQAAVRTSMQAVSVPL